MYLDGAMVVEHETITQLMSFNVVLNHDSQCSPPLDPQEGRPACVLFQAQALAVQQGYYILSLRWFIP